MALMKTAKKISANMEKVLGARTLWKVIGTDVPHAHVHLIPYDETWEHGRTLKLKDEEMKSLQEKLALK